MIKVVVFGTGKGSLIVESALKDDIEIVCYLDNNKDKWNTIYNGRKVIRPDNIVNIEYDYIIIGSQFIEPIYDQLLQYEVNEKKIFRAFAYLDYPQNIIKQELKKIELNEYEVIATGLSYMNYALMNAEMCKKKLISFANASQDIYYDYNIVKFVLNSYKYKSNKIGYAIIGLSYYSFQYDMSLSSMKGRVPIYYEAIGLEHHFTNSKEFIKRMSIDKELAKILFRMDSYSRVMINWYQDVEDKIKLTDEAGKRQAQIDCNKNYPETVKENIQIMCEYLQFLNDNRIMPIIMICPVSKYYSKYFPVKMINDFYKIIKEMKKKYKFKFYDYFESNYFVEDDFFDVSHLNTRGSKKFISLIENIFDT